MTSDDIRWAELRARNLNLPGIDPGKPALPTRQLPTQKPCDLGLFGDDAKQIDLLNLIARKP